MLKINKLKLLLGTFSVALILGACSNEQTEEPNAHQDHQEHGEEVTEDRGHTPVAGAEKPPHHFNDNASENLLTLNTKNVTRLNSDDPIELSIITAQTIWPATHEDNQPGTIILAPLDQWQLALASLNLVHHPNDGPVLFTENGTISDRVITEIGRLAPKGNIEGTQIIAMGEIAEEEKSKLDKYNTTYIEVTDPAEFAKEIDTLYSELANEVPKGVIIGSLQHEDILYSTIAGGWISHMSEPILYVNEEEIPQATIEALEKRNGTAELYVVAPEDVIGEAIMDQLAEYGNVTRINGSNPVEMSVEFAKFKDAKTNFGWGVNKPGHGIVVASTENPMLAIAAAPFAHLGKHAPTVWVENGELNSPLYQFLAQLKPTFEVEPTEGPYNHAYLLGSTQTISFLVQGVIDEKLEIVPAGGAGHHGH